MQQHATQCSMQVHAVSCDFALTPCYFATTTQLGIDAYLFLIGTARQVGVPEVVIFNSS